MSQIHSSELSFQHDGTMVITPSALWMAAVAPCVLLSLAVGRLLWQRSASLKARTPVTIMAAQIRTDDMTSLPTEELSLVAATVKLLRHPLPGSDTTWYTPVPTRNRRVKQSQLVLPISSGGRDLTTACDIAPIAPPLVAPRIVVSPPEDESPLARFLPFKSGWIVPKQDIGGSLLVVPGAPTTSAHFALRLR